MPTVDWNERAWGEVHGWAAEGDEWSGMAAHCGQPYAAWKERLVEAFVVPYTENASAALEIAPGHGRWSEILIDRCASVALVDLNQSCIDVCRERFGDVEGVSFHVNDGRTLPAADRSVDFVWSFDSFVHMDPDVIGGYLTEIGRVLRPRGTVVLHHADKRDLGRPLRPLTGRLGPPGRAAQRIVDQGRLRDSGNRSDTSAADVASRAEQAGLHVLFQTDRWGPDGIYTVAKYHDAITVAALID